MPKNRFHLKVILNVLGSMLFFNGLFMLACLPIALIYQAEGGGMMEMAGFWEFLIPGLGSILFGLGSWLATRKHSGNLSKRDGYLIVSLGWLLMSVVGALPYYLFGGVEFPDFACALFESVSGFTTTGASVINDIEAMPRSILFWRSLTHWIGGMGIIVLTIAILPLLGIGGMQLFVAEAPGPTADKLHPRITETAKRLWVIYVMLTVVETILLLFCGLDLYHAVNHAFATVSTGGFSTQNASLAAYGPAVHYVVIVFMFLSGMNFSLTYWGLKGQLHRIWRNEEFRAYLFSVLIITAIATALVFSYDPQKLNVSLEEAFRDALFQVIAVITTTGFVTEDFTAWGPFLKVVFFLMMFMGASAGSTSGGVKIVRHILILKNGILEFKRQLHPHAILPLRYNKKAVEGKIAYNVLAFFLVYMALYCFGCLIMAAWGFDFETVLGSVATSLGNVGPGLGQVNPVSNFAFFNQGQKFFLSFLMLLGRLELFTVLIVLTPFFWKKY